MELFAVWKMIINLSATAQKVPPEIHTFNVKESKDANQIVSVQVIRLALTENVLPLATVALMLSALSEIIKLRVNVLKGTKGIPMNFADHPQILVTPTHVELELFVSLIEEIQFVIALRI
jgi:hypothetical protein